MTFFVYLPVGNAWLAYKHSLNSNQTEDSNVDIVPDIKKGEEFKVVIPKILAEANVISNVDVTDKKTFDKILGDNNVALSAGSDKPGDGKGKLLYIFAHSTSQNIVGARKNAVFYLLNELVSDDEVYIYFNGQKFTYIVYDKKVVSSKDISYFKYKIDDKEVIILQTCWPLGTNWKRLLILAKRI